MLARSRRWVAFAFACLALMAVWPGLSNVYLGVLKEVAAGLAEAMGGLRIERGPWVLSPILLPVTALLLASPLFSWARKFAWCAALLGALFIADVTIVLLTARFGAAAAIVTLQAGAQFVLAFGALLLASRGTLESLIR